MEDLEELVSIRIAAMRESLERIGRFDETRARQRLTEGFDPAITRSIDFEGTRVGFYALCKGEDGLYLDHLYIHPNYQGKGFGSAVLDHVKNSAEGQRIRLGALKESESNRFYVHHGFRFEREEERDNYYVFP